jgi:hypothetical protein
MRFEQSVEIDAPQQRVWDVLTDIARWPERIETVKSVELLTPPPMAVGGRVHMKQPRLPEEVWDVTVWDPPSYFEWRQEASGATTVAGHRVDVLEGGRSRLALTLDMRGLLIPILGRIFQGLTNRYMTTEAESIRRAAEAPETSGA